MKDLVKKVAVGLATGALVAQSMVLPSFATLNIVVSGNGEKSVNTVDVDHTTTTTVNQSNTANVKNNISASSSSGDNSAKSNTGGDVTIGTGDAKSVVDVSNKLNSNEASVACGGCLNDVKVTISGNGEKSKTDVDLDLTNTTWVKQNNKADVDNDVDVDADSGNNQVKGTTGGDVSIDTGKATAYAKVNNVANANVAQVAGGKNQAGALDIIVTGNGEDSDTDLDLDLTNTVGVEQDNYADISNDVDVDANSGYNEAESNTGGSSSIDTGDAWAGATVDTLANLNVANVEDCCTFDGTVKVAGNGENSDQNIDLDLTSTAYASQDNDYLCGGSKGWSWWWHRDDCDVNANADSGYNSLKGNTEHDGNDPSIDTGKAATEVAVSHEANSNVFTTGDALPELPKFHFDGQSLSWWMLLMGMSTH